MTEPHTKTTPMWGACSQDSPLVRLLIVTESVGEGEPLRQRLQDTGYSPLCEHVATAEALQEALTRQSWDLVCGLPASPAEDGLKTIQVVRDHAPEVPVILISNTPGEDAAVAAMRSGAADYLMRDNLAQFAPAVERCLNMATEHRKRRHAEERLRVLRHAVEQSPAILVITDTAGRIEYVNPRFTQITGYSWEAAQGRNSRFLKSGETSPEEYVRLWKTILNGGQWKGVLVNRKQDGRLYWEAAAISPVYDHAGGMTHFVKVAEDITRRRQAEQALKKLDRQMQRAQKMEALGELAGGIAHDFNSYLGAILVNVELARSTCDEPQAWSEYLDRVTLASRQAAGLARQILTYSGRRDQHRRPLQLGPLVRETLRVLRSTLPATIDVRLDISPTVPEVRADVAQLQQVIVNLWTNACHALGQGPGQITVSVQPVRVEPQMALRHDLQPGGYVRLSFHDNGCGITAANQENVFDAFFSTKPEGQGTGLGLSVVKSIMREHRGAVLVESQPGKGTSMILLFPAELEPVDAVEETGPAPPTAGQRILLVEDQALMREAMRELLVQRGYQVTTTDGAKQALDAFRTASEPFDLVLTDLSLGEMNGAELAHELRAIQTEMPIVLTTGYDLAGVRSQLEALGVQQVLRKPVSPETLTTAIDQALAASRLTECSSDVSQPTRASPLHSRPSR